MKLNASLQGLQPELERASSAAFLLMYYLSDFYKNIIALRKKIKPWEITLSLTSSFHWLQTSLGEGYSLGLCMNFFF